MFEFFSPKRKVLVAILVLVGFVGILSFGFFSFSKPAEAGLGGTLLGVGVAGLAAWGIGEGVSAISDIIDSFDILMIRLLAFFSKLLGKIFTWVVGMLVDVAAYNNFLGATAVITGWVIVRDLANMFFILILLVISIATILRVEAYSYKKLLPKLLLMAVLINFSKTICGIIIDFSQVIMLTFVNAFQAAAGANFFQALGVHQLFSFENLAEGAGAGDQQWDLVGTAFLALIVVLVATITVGVLMVVLVARIVILWTLIVLSPLAYLLASFPQGQQYAKQWWDEFSKYVISGPILAFFIWLALIVAGGGTANTEIGVDSTALDAANGLGDIGKYNNLSSLVVGVTMLLVGLMFTQKLGIIGSGVAGAALSGLRRAGTTPFRLAKGGVGLAWKGAKGAAKFGAGRASELTYATTGVALPFSERRKKGNEEKRRKRVTIREAEGKAKSAVRSAGGRAWLASVLDPSVASGVTAWEKTKATFGGKEAQAKVRRAADSLAGAAADEMRPVDKFQGERLKQRTEAQIAERQLEKTRKDPEFRGVMATRDAELSATVTTQQTETATKEAEANRLSTINKFQKRVGLNDADLREVMVEDKAQEDLKQEKVRRERAGLPKFSGREENRFLTDRRNIHNPVTTLADAAAERVMIQGALVGVAPVTEEEVASSQKEFKEAAANLETAARSLETFRDRNNNPKAARADALSRREAAREKGNDAEVRKINLELGELEPVVKIKDVNNFFKMSYEEQVKVAVKSAEGLSESKLAKDVASALKGGEITRGERDEVMKLWAEKDFHAAKERLDDILKKVRAAKQTP
ncbi:MAG: hypothetical protein WC348_01360 [Patescibacteria group bacterium]|jgi:hypothetical protein